MDTKNELLYDSKDTVPKTNSWFMQFHNSQPTKRSCHPKCLSLEGCILVISKTKDKQCPEQSLEKHKWTKQRLHTPPEQAIVNTSDHISAKISYQNYHSLCVTENTIRSKHHAIPMILLISRKLVTYTKDKVSRACPEFCSRLLSHPCCRPYYINIFANILSITYTNSPTPQRSQTDYDK